MIQFKHYSRMPQIGSGNCRFRRYSQAVQTDMDLRFAQFIDGSLEEIGPEDFGSMTSVPDYAFAGLVLERLELPDAITTVPATAFSAAAYTPRETIFPVTFLSVPQALFVAMAGNRAGECTLDFTKVKQVVTMTDVNLSFSDAATFPTVKVPAGLYDAWIKTDGWSDAGVVPHIVAV